MEFTNNTFLLIIINYLCFFSVFFFRPQEIDEAARRRLVKRLYIPLPEGPARRQIVSNLLKDQSYELTDEEMDAICQKTQGMFITQFFIIKGWGY